MDPQDAIQEKIKVLQQKLEGLQKKQQETFFKELKRLSSQELSLETVLGCLVEHMQNASPDQLKKWESLGHTFFRSKNKSTKNDLSTKNQAA